MIIFSDCLEYGLEAQTLGKMSHKKGRYQCIVMTFFFGTFLSVLFGGSNHINGAASGTKTKSIGNKNSSCQVKCRCIYASDDRNNTLFGK